MRRNITICFLLALALILPIVSCDPHYGNTSTADNPYTASDAASLQDLINQHAYSTIYIDIDSTSSIDVAESESLVIPSGKDILLTIDGSLELSDGATQRSTTDATTAVDGYALIDSNGMKVPASEAVLITVESGATLRLKGTGRIGGTLKDNPSRHLIWVEEGGELIIDGNLTFVAFPYNIPYEDKTETWREKYRSAIYSAGKMTINGGKFFSTFRTVYSDKSSLMTINDGTFVSVASNHLKTGYAYTVTGAGESYIHGGTYYGMQGALGMNSGKGAITNATTRLAPDIFDNIEKLDASVKTELEAFYNLNVSDSKYNTSNLADDEFWHGIYVAGEDGEVTNLTISGGSFYTEGASGWGLCVGNSNDGGLGLQSSVNVTGGTFYSKFNNAVNCSDAGTDGYGKGYLQISGGRFKTDGSGKTTGITEKDLVSGYAVSTSADSEGYYSVVRATQ